MSRLALGITLAIVAIAIALAGCISFFQPIGLVCPLTSRASLVTHFFDGRMRFFWITREDRAIRVTHHWRGPYLEIAPQGQLARQEDHYKIGNQRRATRSGDLIRISIGGRRFVGPFGGQWRSRSILGAAAPGNLEVSFLRFPMWLPVLVLLLQPIKAIIFGPWRSRRRERLNLCQGCGYDLRSLPSARCPECGRVLSRTSPWTAPGQS